ncbi:MAG: hypothetical protein GY943_30525 [Chloroflexi bacterium]|nr:hypothetical protein [Chloroflexota bacterium]
MDWGYKNAVGRVPGESTIQKFGFNSAVGTSFVPICEGGIYRTPQVSGATALRVKAGDVVDTADGAGAREVTIQGLSATGEWQQSVLATAGESASAATTETYIRLFRYIITKSGTYATQSAGSHDSDIVIENAAGTEDWATITATDYPRGQSQIGCYSVPLGYEAYVTAKLLQVDARRKVDALFMQRRNILETAAPYSAMRLVQEFGGMNGPVLADKPIPHGPFPALTDLMFFTKVEANTGDVGIDFTIQLVEKSD